MHNINDRILGFLPDVPRKKLERFAEEAEASNAVIARAIEDLNYDIGRRQSFARELAKMERESRFIRGANDANIAMAKEKLEAADRDVDRAKKRVARATEDGAGYKVVHEVAAWLAMLPGQKDGPKSRKFKHVAAKPPKVHGKDFLREIQSVRAEIRGCDHEWKATVDAPRDADSLIAPTRAVIAKYAEQGAPRFNPSKRDGDPFDLTDRLKLIPHNNSFLGDAGASFFVWLLRDQIEERFTDIIRQNVGSGGLTDAERDKRFAEIAARKLDAERREEALICAAEEIGQRIPRRHDADPRAILEIEEV